MGGRDHVYERIMASPDMEVKEPCRTKRCPHCALEVDPTNAYNIRQVPHLRTISYCAPLCYVNHRIATHGVSHLCVEWNTRYFRRLFQKRPEWTFRCSQIILPLSEIQAEEELVEWMQTIHGEASMPQRLPQVV